MEKTLDFFNELAKSLIVDELQNPVSEYIPSADSFDRLDLELKDDPIDPLEFKSLVKDLVLSTPKTASKGFFNQLFGCRNEHAILGELLSVILNNSMYTYKAAGPMVGVEMVIIKKLIEMVGWDNSAGGTLASGGSMTNLMSMIMARDAHDQSVRFSGLQKK